MQPGKPLRTGSGVAIAKPKKPAQKETAAKPVTKDAPVLTTDGVAEVTRKKFSATIDIVELADGRILGVSSINHIVYSEEPAVVNQKDVPNGCIVLPLQAYTLNLSEEGDLKTYNNLISMIREDNPRAYINERVEFHKGVYYALVQVRRILYRRILPQQNNK